MKIIDNWNYLRDKLDFSDPDKFYFIELMQRKKDNSEFPANNRMVKYYFVYSLDYYNRIEDEVKKLSNCTGSRVYILLNRRSYKKCCLNLLADASKMIIDNNFQHFPNLVSSVIGKYSDESNKNWIIDIDNELSKEELIKLHTFIDDLEPVSEPNTSKLKFSVPTLHGCHLITSPFNCQKFSQVYPNIDIHKDNPTLLYFKSNEEFSD
jgi:hypothetical protein